MKAFRLSSLLVPLSAAALLAACSDTPEPEYQTITLHGKVSMVAGPMPEGKLHFRLYNLWYLEGDLRHPLEEIEDFESNSAEFTHTFEYPLHKGTGLALHAWLDSDGDGIFCTPTARTDPAGITTFDETPAAGDLDIEVKLTENCRQAGYFYPPRAG